MTRNEKIKSDVKKMEECYLKIIEQQTNKDVEVAHSIADDILCKILTLAGYGAVVKEYKKVTRHCC